MPEKSFFSIVDNPEIFEFKNINLSKYFHDNYVTRQIKEKTSPVYKNKNTFRARTIITSVYHLFLGLLNIAKLRLSSRPDSKYLFAGSGSDFSTIKGNNYDQFNVNIIDYIGRSNFINLQTARKKHFNRYSPDLILNDYLVLLGIIYIFVNIFLRREIHKFSKQLFSSYPELGYSVSEITKSVSTFFFLFLFYRFIIKLFKPKGVFVICHYSFHYLITACKKEHIKTIELMHGLITKSHRHYCIPDLPNKFRRSFNENMLPDYLSVYGEYWRNNVISGKQFLPENVINIGYYLKTPPKNIIDEPRSEKTTILITTQATVQNELISYVKFLKSSLNPAKWKIVIKPHDTEDPCGYLQLIIPGFIEIVYTNVYILLQQADIHISAYSTVLFEALFYNITNYSLYIAKVSNHCNEILSSGVAQRLNTNEIPKQLGRNKMINTKDYFNIYNPEKLFGVFNINR